VAICKFQHQSFKFSKAQYAIDLFPQLNLKALLISSTTYHRLFIVVHDMVRYMNFLRITLLVMSTKYR